MIQTKYSKSLIPLKLVSNGAGQVRGTILFGPQNYFTFLLILAYFTMSCTSVPSRHCNVMGGCLESLVRKPDQEQRARATGKEVMGHTCSVCGSVFMCEEAFEGLVGGIIRKTSVTC